MSTLSDLFATRYQISLEEEMRETFAGQDGLLFEMLRYQLGWVEADGTPRSGLSGNGLHPALCLLSCEALSGDHRPGLIPAAAVELVHNYSLIHEDVQSGSPNRGPRPSVWWVWGPGQAINAGDGMHALGRLALMRLEQDGHPVPRVLEAMHILDQACLKMCEGQHMDLSFQDRLDVGVGPYLKMAAARTGALVSCAMGLGALVATASPEAPDVVEKFQQCGTNLGVAFQISEDLRELRETSPDQAHSGNVAIKKKLLPIVYTLESGEMKARRELGTLYFKRILEPQDVVRIGEILEEQGALDSCVGRVEEYCQTALNALEGTDLSSWGRAQLEQMCTDLTGREG